MTENCKNKIIKDENIYIFVLGRETKIALVELISSLRLFGFDFLLINVSGKIAFIKIKNTKKVDMKHLIKYLGGTIKIYKASQEVEQSGYNYQIKKFIIEKLKQIGNSGMLNFALADYTGTFNLQELKNIGLEIKKTVKKYRSVRFIEGKDCELSGATSYHKIFKKRGREYAFFKLGMTTEGLRDKLIIGTLLAVFNPDEWSRRDYGKPAGDKYNGMTPPKLARMMLNIALDIASIDKFRKTDDKNLASIYGNSNIYGDDSMKNRMIILDPFCGSGNILMEAKTLGFKIIGCDISKKAVLDTKNNLRWLAGNNNQKEDDDKANYKEEFIFEADATQRELGERVNNYLSDKCGRKSADLCIITEPYLGSPKKRKIADFEMCKFENEELKSLKDLYINFFKNLLWFEKTGLKIKAIIFIFPLFERENGKQISLYRELVDELQKIGYNAIRTLKYGRDYQAVKREIALLQLKKRRIQEPKND